MNGRKRILLLYKWVSIYPWKIPTYAQKDFDLLKEDFQVTSFSFSFLKIPTLIGEIYKSNLVFIWFGGEHAFMTALITRFIKRPIVVVLGGFEVAFEKDVKYGFMRNPLLRFMVKYVLKKADRVIPVGESLITDAKKHMVLNLKNIQALPTGYDVKFFKPKGEKENIAMTVALCPDWNRVRLKGIDTFVEAANHLPNIKFLVIGIQDEAMEKLKEIIPKNVELYGPLFQEELIKYYQKAKVYCQLSMREGLPNTVCEAMLCECIPIGTNVDGIKTAIGDAGYYVDFGNVTDAVNTIKKAIDSSNNLGKKARERIKNNFSDGIRKEKLIKLFLELIKKT